MSKNLFFFLNQNLGIGCFWFLWSATKTPIVALLSAVITLSWCSDGVLTFHQVPLVEIDGMKLIQTKAILNYIAGKYNLYGKDIKERVMWVQVFNRSQRTLYIWCTYVIKFTRNHTKMQSYSFFFFKGLIFTLRVLETAWKWLWFCLLHLLTKNRNNWIKYRAKPRVVIFQHLKRYAS